MSTAHPSPIRVLHVISSLDGGAGLGVLELVNRLRQDKQFEVRLCVLGNPPNGSPIPNDATIEYLHAPVHIRSRTVIRLTRLRQLIQQWQPHILHSHLWPSALTLGLVAPPSIPHLIHVRDTPPSLKSNTLGSRFRRGMLRRLLSRPNVRLTAVSAAAARYTAEAFDLPEDCIRVILNGAELQKFLDVPALPTSAGGPLILASAGRLIPDKGFDILIRAVSLIEHTPETLTLLIAGTGSAESQLRQQSRDLGVEGSVRFEGQVRDMPTFFSRASLYVHASVAAEGLSRALMEAQASGRPVVSSDHAGANEAIEDQVTGIIVPPHNPAEFANAIRSLMNHPDRLRSMGQQARTRASLLFSAQRVTSEVVQTYCEMLRCRV